MGHSSKSLEIQIACLEEMGTISHNNLSNLQNDRNVPAVRFEHKKEKCDNLL